MTTIEPRGLLAHFRRAGPPALLAACLAASPALAQTTVITTDRDKAETSDVKIKEKNDKVVIKSKEKDDGDTVKSKTTIDEDGDMKTKTTVR